MAVASFEVPVMIDRGIHLSFAAGMGLGSSAMILQSSYTMGWEDRIGSSLRRMRSRKHATAPVPRVAR
jgi:hypothetical protein